MAKILYTRPFKNKFGYCMSRNPSEVKIVVPYFGDTPFGRIVQFARLLERRECALHLITCPPSSSNGRMSPHEAFELSRMDVVSLLITAQPKLHAKIYQFYFPNEERLSFVGSSNFSKGGFITNHEVVAFFDTKEDNMQIEAEIARVEIGSLPYNNYLANKPI